MLAFGMEAVTVTKIGLRQNRTAGKPAFVTEQVRHVNSKTSAKECFPYNSQVQILYAQEIMLTLL